LDCDPDTTPPRKHHRGVFLEGWENYENPPFKMAGVREEISAYQIRYTRREIAVF